MKNLYAVTLKRTSYNGQSSTIEKREIFAESPKRINRYRLGGFQQDTIEIVKARKIRERHTIEIEGDIERNELSFSICAEDHLDTTLESASDIEDAASEAELDIGEYLESIGYKEAASDNTYNYGSDFDNEIQFTVYTKQGSRDWLHDDGAVLVARIHAGLDVRGGYGAERAYRGGSWDGFCNFLDFHVRLTVFDADRNEVDSFDGDSAGYRLLKKYALVSACPKTQKIIVSKDGVEYSVSFYHPAEGI